MDSSTTTSSSSSFSTPNRQGRGGKERLYTHNGKTPQPPEGGKWDPARLSNSNPAYVWLKTAIKEGHIDPLVLQASDIYSNHKQLHRISPAKFPKFLQDIINEIEYEEPTDPPTTFNMTDTGSYYNGTEPGSSVHPDSFDNKGLPEHINALVPQSAQCSSRHTQMHLPCDYYKYPGHIDVIVTCLEGMNASNTALKASPHSKRNFTLMTKNESDFTDPANVKKAYTSGSHDILEGGKRIHRKVSLQKNNNHVTTIVGGVKDKHGQATSLHISPVFYQGLEFDQDVKPKLLEKNEVSRDVTLPGKYEIVPRVTYDHPARVGQKSMVFSFETFEEEKSEMNYGVQHSSDASDDDSDRGGDSGGGGGKRKSNHNHRHYRRRSSSRGRSSRSPSRSPPRERRSSTRGRRSSAAHDRSSSRSTSPSPSHERRSSKACDRSLSRGRSPSRERSSSHGHSGAGRTRFRSPSNDNRSGSRDQGSTSYHSPYRRGGGGGGGGGGASPFRPPRPGTRGGGGEHHSGHSNNSSKNNCSPKRTPSGNKRRSSRSGSSSRRSQYDGNGLPSSRSRLSNQDVDDDGYDHGSYHDEQRSHSRSRNSSAQGQTPLVHNMHPIYRYQHDAQQDVNSDEFSCHFNNATSLGPNEDEDEDAHNTNASNRTPSHDGASNYSNRDGNGANNSRSSVGADPPDEIQTTGQDDDNESIGSLTWNTARDYHGSVHGDRHNISESEPRVGGSLASGRKRRSNAGRKPGRYA